jgi:hypothetical protein
MGGRLSLIFETLRIGFRLALLAPLRLMQGLVCHQTDFSSRSEAPEPTGDHLDKGVQD